jgi:hypothetical protein
VTQAATADTAPSPPPEPAPSWASAVKALPDDEVHGPVQHERAVIPDRAYSGGSRISVRRLVYRVYFVVPKTFRENRTLVKPPAGELTVDVSNDRLRARFSGPAWPVQDGTQVRLRRDTLGVYVFDGNGGRQLSPGQLALWFEGRGTPGVQVNVRVRRETSRATPGPGELVCALLAEWTGQPREAVMRRCSHGALPPGFAFGPWRAELTAIVPMELPASQMRGDELDPPTLPTPETTRMVLASGEVHQIEIVRFASDPPVTTPLDPEASGSLRVVNESDSRALVCAAGIPLAWVDPHQEGRIEGLRPGRHMIGALRAFGALAGTRRPVEIPGTVTLRPH